MAGPDYITQLYQKLNKHEMNSYLPSVITVGEQSSGKSSLLQSLLKSQILPVDEKIATRTLLKLTFYPTDAQDYFQFEGCNEKLTDEDVVRARIETEMTKLCKKANVDVSDEVIAVNIFKKDAECFRIWDAPGLVLSQSITHSENVVQKIRNLVERLCMDKKNLLLPIIPAPSSPVNSQGLEMSMRCNPDTLRSLPVLTKTDLYKGFESVRVILENRPKSEESNDGVCRLYMRNGYHAVAVEPREPYSTEEDFFSSIKELSTMIHKTGVANLRTRLHHVLYRHVREHIGEVEKDVRERLANLQTKRDGLEREMSAILNPHDFICDLIADLHSSLCSSIYGFDIHTLQFYSLGGKTLGNIFNSELRDTLGKSLATLHTIAESLSTAEIREKLKNIDGINIRASCRKSDFSVHIVKYVQALVIFCIDKHVDLLAPYISHLQVCLESHLAMMISWIFKGYPLLQALIKGKLFERLHEIIGAFKELAGKLVDAKRVNVIIPSFTPSGSGLEVEKSLTSAAFEDSNDVTIAALLKFKAPKQLQDQLHFCQLGNRKFVIYAGSDASSSILYTCPTDKLQVRLERRKIFVEGVDVFYTLEGDKPERKFTLSFNDDNDAKKWEKIFHCSASRGGDDDCVAKLSDSVYDLIIDKVRVFAEVTIDELSHKLLESIQELAVTEVLLKLKKYASTRLIVAITKTEDCESLLGVNAECKLEYEKLTGIIDDMREALELIEKIKNQSSTEC